MPITIEINAQAPGGVRKNDCAYCQYGSICGFVLGERRKLTVTPGVGEQPVDENTARRFSKIVKKLGLKPCLSDESNNTTTDAGAVWELVKGKRLMGRCAVNSLVNLQATTTEY
jgi:hypothetical protein